MSKSIESKVASNKAFLKVKEIKVSNEIKSIVALISHDTKSEIIRDCEAQLQVCLKEYEDALEKYQIILIENIDDVDLPETLGPLNERLMAIKREVLLCRNKLLEFGTSNSNENLGGTDVIKVCHLKMPELKLDTFSDNEQDPFAFDGFRNSLPTHWHPSLISLR